MAAAAPLDQVEQIVSSTWADVLGATAPDPDENFFALGGDSLKAVQVAARLRDVARSAEVPMSVVFLNPTIRALSTALKQGLGEAPALPPLEPRAPRDRPPLAPRQEAVWKFQRLHPDCTAFLEPIAIRLRGPLDVDAFGASVEAVVARHEPLRTTFPSPDGRPHQRVEDAGPALRNIDVGSAEEAMALANAEAERLFDLEREPPLHATLIRLAPDDHVALLYTHFIVSDGWSARILLHDLGAHYSARTAGEEPDLPPLPIRYRDFAAWQREVIASPALDPQRAFWRQELAGAEAAELRCARPGPPSFATGHASDPWSADLWAAVQERARIEDATPFMILVAAYHLVLAAYSGSEDVVVACPVAGRRSLELEPLVGLFASPVMLRGILDDRPTHRALLARTRETALRAFANQDVPYAAALERSPAAPRLDRYYFTFMDAPTAAELGGFAGLDVSLVDVPRKQIGEEISLVAWPGTDGFTIYAEFNADRFALADIERLLDDLRATAARGAADPDAPAALPA